MRALLREALAVGARLIVPAAIVGQVFRSRSKQVALGALLDAATTDVPPLDRPLAEAVGVLCGHTRTSDVVDACVVLIARRERALVVTSDVKDLTRLDPSLKLERI